MPVVVGGSVGAADGIDLLDYLRGDGRAYIVHHPDGNQEKFRTVRDGARWLQLAAAIVGPVAVIVLGLVARGYQAHQTQVRVARLTVGLRE